MTSFMGGPRQESGDIFEGEGEGARRNSEGSEMIHPKLCFIPLQGLAKKWFPGWVNFVPALAYHFCLALPAAFTQPGNGNSAQPCTPVSLTSSLSSSSLFSFLSPSLRSQFSERQIIFPRNSGLPTRLRISSHIQIIGTEHH